MTLPSGPTELTFLSVKYPVSSLALQGHAPWVSLVMGASHEMVMRYSDAY